MAHGHWLKDYIGPHSGGSGGGGTEPLIVTVNYTGSIETLDKTWQEIHDAFVGGRAVIVHPDNSNNYYYITSVTTKSVPLGAEYIVVDSVNISYKTDFADGYPQHGNLS